MTSRTRLRTIVVGLVAAAALGAGGYSLAATATVQLTATGPQPPVATVSWGDTVVFQNADDAPLTIVSGHTDFGSPAIPPGGTYQKVFDGKVGNYPYRATKPKEKGGTTSIHGSVVVKMTATLTLSATPTMAVLIYQGELGDYTQDRFDFRALRFCLEKRFVYASVYRRCN